MTVRVGEILARLTAQARAIGAFAARAVVGGPLRFDRPVATGRVGIDLASIDGAPLAVEGVVSPHVELLGLDAPRVSGRRRLVTHPWGHALAATGAHGVVGFAVTRGPHLRGGVWLLGAGNRAEAEVLRQHAPDLYDAWMATLPPRSFTLLVGSGGDVTPTCGTGADWLRADPHRAGRVAELAQARAVVDGARLRWLTTELADGVAGVVLADPAPVPQIPPLMRLTPAQWRIAELMSSGVTVAEAAAIAGVSAQTAKSHLRTVYRTLGVRNRIELANALRALE